MSLFAWFRSRPTRPLLAALLAVGTLAALSLVWGAFSLAMPPRLHLAALTAVLTILAATLVLLSHRGNAVRVAARFVSAIVFLAVGLGLGGYDHLLRVVLTSHGLVGFGPVGDVGYEALGILLLPVGLGALATLKGLSLPKDEE